jgi:hypothetical protein
MDMVLSDQENIDLQFALKARINAFKALPGDFKEEIDTAESLLLKLMYLS